MPTTYTRSENDQATAILKGLIDANFEDLREAGVSITILMAYNEDGAPVKWARVPAAAVIKVNSLKDRTEGKGDATITIDEDRWEGLSDRRKTALIHHELLHLSVARDKKGAVKRDNVDRPVLKVKPDDFVISGFNRIVELYGEDANERVAVEQIVEGWEEEGIR